MLKLRKILIFELLLLFVIAVSGCTGGQNVKKSLEQIHTGTEGIAIGFLPNNPPDEIHVEQQGTDTFDVILDIRNRGAYPQPDDSGGIASSKGKVFLSGYDTNIISFRVKDARSGQQGTSSGGLSFGDLSKMSLEGKSIINLNGGQDVIAFTGSVDGNKLNVEKYEPTFLATACYYYETAAGQSVCIDPDPYSTISEKKVCEVKDVSLSGQGAPIAVTKIDEQAFAYKTQFRITIKNAGNGEVMTQEAAENKCDPLGNKKVERDDIDKVNLETVKIGEQGLTCGPFADAAVKGASGAVRLINGEGSFICDMPKDMYGRSTSAYTTPMLIKLSYGYRTTAEKIVRIIKEKT